MSNRRKNAQNCWIFGSLPQPLPKGKGFSISPLMPISCLVNRRVKETKSQRDEESKRLRDKETKRQRQEERKRLRDKKKKGQRQNQENPLKSMAATPLL